MTFCYTKLCVNKQREIKEYRKLYKTTKPPCVSDAEQTLLNSRSITVAAFNEFLHNRVLVANLLKNHYSENATEDGTVLLYRKLKLPTL
jgi:hypothetical protein